MKNKNCKNQENNQKNKNCGNKACGERHSYEHGGNND